MPSIRPYALTSVLALLCAWLLAACGGGGDSTDTAVGGAAGAAVPAAPVASAPEPIVVRLSGVAALGAPMSDALVRVVDATGQLVGSTTTHPADGSYALTLKPSLAPLMVQASGTDATGQPLVLHSAVSAVAAASFANLTPLTEAIVALALGSDPKAVFAGAATTPAALAALSSLTASSDLVKSLVKTNLSDAKVGDAKKLDLLGDPAFRANKTGVDLALETIALSYGTSNTGVPQMLLGNKLANAPAEVTVDLGTARTELAKGTGGKPATAVISTLKFISSPTTVVGSLGFLDDLTSTLNRMIADGSGANTDIVQEQMLAGYTGFDGSDAAMLSGRIADWTARKMQIGRMQVLGCANETIPKSGCTLVNVAARISDAKGENVETFVDTVRYSTTTTPRWSLVGNGQLATLALHSIAALELDKDGSPTTASASGAPSPNPNIGVQLVVGAGAAAATVQTPGGFGLSLVQCAPPYLCLAQQAGEGYVQSTFQLADDAVMQSTNQWFGTSDLAPEARYRFSVLPPDGSTAIARTAILRQPFAAVPATSRFAVIDDIKSSQPLSGGAMLTETTISWAQWAAANPDMRVIAVRRVLTGDEGYSVLLESLPRKWGDTSVVLQEPASDFGVTAIDLFIVAVDTAGRRYYTRYSVL
jgi:hypothetical protein